MKVYPKSKRYKKGTREYGFKRKVRKIPKEFKKVILPDKPYETEPLRDIFGRWKGSKKVLKK